MDFDDSCEYILQARLMVIDDKYDKAFDILLAAFERIPSLIPIYEEEFCSVLLMLNLMLAGSKHNRLADIFNNFSKALKIFPNNPLLLNDIGKYLYKYGFHKEALDQFQEIMHKNPAYVEGEKNVNSMKNILVHRWHFRMLNDNLRNESYRQAILRTISQEDKVLDVGTGTGLLAIYANEARPSSVIGCDGSKVMCNIADNVIGSNKKNNIIVINKMSTDLTVSEIGGRCSKLVTELFDAGLFGEHVLQMLSHALPNLMSAGAEVLPHAAEFFVMAAQCDHLSKNYKLGVEAKSLLNIPFMNVHAFTQGDTYDSEDVHLIKDIKYLSEPKSVLKINFNDVQDVAKNLEKSDAYEVELLVKENGMMNILVGWFNLHLTESITITTNPRAPERANAWQQAIFFDDVPKTVQEKETINLKFLMNGGQLKMVPTTEGPITRVSPEIIRFLNDTEYINTIINCFSEAYQHLVKIKEISELNIVDLCPFPLFGLLMLKRGAKSLICSAKSEPMKQFILNVFLQNEIPVTKVKVVLGDDWEMTVFEEETYHAIFNHSLEVCGDVDVRLERDQTIQTMRETKLVQGGLWLPHQVMLVAQLVSSHWLDLNNRLNDTNVSGYTIATHLNKYKVSQNFDIDFSTLKYVPISKPIELSDMGSTNRQLKKLVKVTTDGYANAILCWYKICVTETAPELSSNRPNSFMNGMLFLTYPKEQLIAGNSVTIIQYKDKDGNFKLVMKPV